MEAFLLWVGRVVGLIGVLLTVVSGALRVTDQFLVAGFQVGTLLLAGIAGMVLGAFCLLLVLTQPKQ